MPRILRDWLKEQLRDRDFLKEYLKDELRFQVSEEVFRSRTERGWSQEKLAEKAGLTQTVVSRVENATHAPTLDTIQKLAYALRMRPRLRLEEGYEFPWEVIASWDFRPQESVEWRVDWQHTNHLPERVVVERVE